MNRQRFLIIGASGFLGANLYARLGPERAAATYYQRPITGGVFFDAGKMRLLDTFLGGEHCFTHAFLMHGITKIDACARDPLGTSKVNVDSFKQIIDDLLAAGVVPIFPSSDAVFDGSRGMWTEEDAPNPILTYGRQKAAVERYLMGINSPWIIARVSKVVGTAPGPQSVTGEWINNIEAGETIRCASDQVFSPAYVGDVVDALIRLGEGNFTGIFNVCGPRPLSRWDLLNLLINEIRRYRSVGSRIISCSIRDFPFPEARPLDTSMSPKKLYSALDTTFEDMEMVCRRAAAQRYGTPGDTEISVGSNMRCTR